MLVTPKQSDPNNFLVMGRDYQVLYEREGRYTLRCTVTGLTSVVQKHRVQEKV